jgi:hypothetical protein
MRQGLVQGVVMVAKLKHEHGQLGSLFVRVDGLSLDETKDVLALAFDEVERFPRRGRDHDWRHGAEGGRLTPGALASLDMSVGSDGGGRGLAR